MLTFLYRLYDQTGDLLYIGITRDPNARFKAHEVHQPWWGQVASHRIEEIDTHAAHRIERELIRAEQPRYNIAGVDRRKAAQVYRLPCNLDDAPEMLATVQAAAALGMSAGWVDRCERDLDGFPQRETTSSGVKKFRRTDLAAWIEAV